VQLPVSTASLQQGHRKALELVLVRAYGALLAAKRTPKNALTWLLDTAEALRLGTVAEPPWRRRMRSHAHRSADLVQRTPAKWTESCEPLLRPN
jgi:hypothetical protein